MRECLSRGGLQSVQLGRGCRFRVFGLSCQLLLDFSLLTVFSGALLGAHPFAGFALGRKASLFRVGPALVERLP